MIKQFQFLSMWVIPYFQLRTRLRLDTQSGNKTQMLLTLIIQSISTTTIYQPTRKVRCLPSEDLLLKLCTPASRRSSLDPKILLKVTESSSVTRRLGCSISTTKAATSTATWLCPVISIWTKMVRRQGNSSYRVTTTTIMQSWPMPLIKTISWLSETKKIIIWPWSQAPTKVHSTSNKGQAFPVSPSKWTSLASSKSP